MARTKKIEEQNTIPSIEEGTSDISSLIPGMKRICVEATFIDNVLGCSPLDPLVMEEYIASRIADKENPYDSEEAKRRFAAEVAAVKNHPLNKDDSELTDEELEQKRQPITVFKRTPDGVPYFDDYIVKGFFKEATANLRQVTGSESSKIKAYKKYVDGRIFVYGDQGDIITINCQQKFDDGKFINFCQRSLRASTPQGERIALAVSEMIRKGAKIRFEIMLLNESDEAWIRELLAYGALKGLGQWRNSGMGRFTVRYLESLDSE